jgi:four helix bundle protein
MARNYDLEQRLLEYAADIIRLTEQLRRTQAGIHVAGQLLRSGTAALPNHGEAQAAESAADCVHKMSICLKELREARRWLMLVQKVPLVRTPASVAPVLKETEELIRIFYSSINTAKKRTIRRGGEC